MLVAPDFFTWHYAAQETGDWFCSIASRCRKPSLPVGSEYLKCTSYASIGVCFKREKLEPVIAAGASFIGGCCGTSPDFIRGLKAALQRA